MSRLLRGALLSVLLAGACADEPAPSEEEGGDEPPGPPRIDLEVPELEVSATEAGEITLTVADLLPGVRVEIDGQRWLPSTRAPAWLDGDTLHVPLGGSMVVGTHELSLVQSELQSEIVTITIVEGEPAPLSATLDDALVASGDRIVAHGQGPDASFGLIDLPSERVWVWAGQWSAEPFELELPGVGGEPGQLDLTIADGSGGRFVALAWMLADRSAVRARVVAVDGHGDPVAEPGAVLELWRRDDPDALALLGQPQLVRLDAVALLDRMVVSAIEARRDAEQLGIGDRVLVGRWLATDGTIGAPLLVRGPSGQDLDLIADARLWTPSADDAALSVRVGLGFPWLLTLADNGLPALEQAPGDLHALASTSTWMRSADAAFGSRHAFAFDADADAPRVQVLRLNRWSAPTQTEQMQEPLEPLELVELPDWPHGPPVLATFDGVATLVIPMGLDTDVLALRSTGSRTVIESIPQLRCDELALAGPGFDGIGDTLPLVCLRDRELRRGFARSE